MRLLLALLVALGLAAWPAPAQARILSRSTEISAGREAASQVEQFYTVDTDPVALSRVRSIGRRLVACADDADFPFEFHVVESGEVNAFALPGGFVYVFRGLLQLVPNDDALAFVLAHEISHVTRHHAIRQFEKSFVLNAGITAILAGTGAGGFGQAADFVQVLAGLAFTRSDEAEADARGMQLFVKAGYTPRAAVEAMTLVKRAGGPEKGEPALLRSHPAPDSRIRKLTEMAAEAEAHRTARPVAAPAAPLPAAPVTRLTGLEDEVVEPCPWYPLAAGARWVYRVRNGSTETAVVARALERLEAEPAGVYRVEIDLGRGIKSTRLIAPAGSRLLSRPEGAAGPVAWTLDAEFDAKHGSATETVTVPAGVFQAARTERRDEDGKVESISWYARGVGLVKRLSSVTGATQELTSYNIPGQPAPARK
jgi:Zn-dependent protease with chaperone function